MDFTWQKPADCAVLSTVSIAVFSAVYVQVFRRTASTGCQCVSTLTEFHSFQCLVDTFYLHFWLEFFNPVSAASKWVSIEMNRMQLLAISEYRARDCMLQQPDRLTVEVLPTASIEPQHLLSYSVALKLNTLICRVLHLSFASRPCSHRAYGFLAENQRFWCLLTMFTFRFSPASAGCIW